MRNTRLRGVYKNKEVALREGDIITFYPNNHQYIVYYDDGTATGQPPYFRYKRLDSDTGLLPKYAAQVTVVKRAGESEEQPSAN